MRTKRFFLLSSVALLLSVPLMLIGYSFGLKGDPFRWWILVGYNAMLVLACVRVIRQGNYTAAERRIWLVWLSFGLWYELMIACVKLEVARPLTELLSVVGFLLAILAVNLSRKLSDKSSRPETEGA